MDNSVAVKDINGDWKRFEVPEEVYMYIRQLECYIAHPDISKLKENYPERFHGGV